MKPIVSIIIPNYNKGELVRHSLDGLLRQTLGEWEAVVVDDCSTDGSWAIIQDYATRDKRIRAVRNEINRGGNYCRNLGVKMSLGKYIVFLDSDDWLSNDCLENRVHEIERAENRTVDLLVFPMTSTMDGKTGRIWRSDTRKDALVGFLRHEIPWTIMMPIWRREAFERVGGFDEAFPRLQDVELHTRALLIGINYKFSERKTPDCFYFTGESRMTTDHLRAVRTFVRAVSMYVHKMRDSIGAADLEQNTKTRLLNALSETSLATISNIGVLYQRGQISKTDRDVQLGVILQSADWGARFHAGIYRGGFNRIRGVNFLSRRLLRFFHAAGLCHAFPSGRA